MYLDAAADRKGEAHVSAIEQVRAGYIFGQDQKAYDRWKRAATPKKRGLVGDALETAVMAIAARFPENVIRGTV